MVLVILSFTMTSGCAIVAQINLPTSDPPVSTSATTSATPFTAVTNTPVVIPATYTPSPTFTPTATYTPSATFTPTPTDTPFTNPTPTLVYYPAGQVIAPILLYHHISDSNYGSRYYVTPGVFRTQMEKLRDWGYSTITVSDLVEVLIYGGELPAQPILITFDDGNIDIYNYAFPIMHELGMVGNFYIIANSILSRGYVNSEQMREMIDDGWEIGSHSMSHADLTVDYSKIRFEVLQSRQLLQEALGEPINTFAYPYGKTDSFVSTQVSDYGYRAGMGLGRSWEHTLGTLFYLSRIEVQSDYSLPTFAALLPWSGD